VSAQPVSHPPELGDALASEVEYLISLLLSEYSGDVLNHVNACTAAAYYLETDHPLLRRLAKSLSELPAAQGADLVFDMLLRFSAAALMGEKGLPVSCEALRRGFWVINEDDSKPVPPFLAIEYIYEEWKVNPQFVLGQGIYSNFLFVQYLARLYTHCGIGVPRKERKAAVQQALKMVDYIERAWSQKQLPSLVMISWALLVASSAALLDVPAQVRRPLDIAVRIAQRPETWNQLEPADLVNLCHIGISVNVLLDDYPREIEFLVPLIEALLGRSLIHDQKAFGDLRLVGLRLAGLRCALDDAAVDRVRHELDAAETLDVIVAIRHILDGFYRRLYEFRQSLKENNFDLNAVSAESLHALINTVARDDIHKMVKDPIDTLESRRGDCKAVTALASVILIYAGIQANVCIYYGKDFARDGTNHIFVEWIGQTSLFGNSPRVYIDQGAPLGQPNRDAVKHDDLIVRYPLQAIASVSIKKILSELTRWRRNKLARHRAGQGS
jgi:hypothetical protein